ncbi:hypothetical protein MH171_000010 [Vibrio parahaemolyticus]|nr:MULTISPECIES: hypothetical protein [Vibrio]EIW7860119.1 hypothetical protein [Vibrio parahaemolyticus]EJG1717144.1 hypothetical protein [Vibrio parahaemolyticus]EJI6691031.1 hypothetical protein [Vibrio parahaemolyticus]EJK2117051.1 hypothetical protein [Vibrio navarrensis]ELA7254578.1 hypothetical protein [Vibrio parahaemolyticus]
MRNILLVLASFSVLSGCTSLKHNGGGVEETLIDHPPIGVEAVAYVGDEMLAKGKQTTVNAISLKYSTSVGVLAGYTFAPGIYTQIGHSQNKIFYTPTQYGMVQASALADPYGGMYVDQKTREICGVSTLGGTVCTSAEFKDIKHTTNDMLSFQQTLLYSGKVGNKINISYREFSNGQARAAFTNDVEYDLNSSKVIGYKGAQVEIIEANNHSVKYKVLKNFR